MKQLTATGMMQSSLSKTGAALLLASLGAACGGADSAGIIDGARADAGSTADDGDTTDSGDKTDIGNTTDSWSPASTGNTTSGSPASIGNTTSGSTADSGGKNDGGTDSGTTSPLAVNLGTAGNYVILAKAGISTVPTSAITGNLGISPAAATYITGFALTLEASGAFSTSTQVTGKVYAADYATPTPSKLTTAIGDMQTAFTDAAGRAPNVTELGAGNIGGMTLTPGVYKWGTGLLIPTNVTLSGSATGVWIFQIAQNLTVSNATSITLTGGAVPKNVFWQVSGSTDIGTTVHFEGVILDQTAIALGTGASVNGRLLAQTAVTLESNSVVEPAP